jgi:large subunit ribosomal protein L5
MIENRLKEKFNKKILPTLLKNNPEWNVMEAPKITKVSVNAGIGPFRDNKEAVESFSEEFAAITSQKPAKRTAKTSEAGFKIKQGDLVGFTSTLRGAKMWAFLDKLISVALPRVRDFRGLKDEAFDVNGNYSLGIKEHVIFPEVNPNTTKGMRSLQVTIVMSGKDTAAKRALLTELGVPFRKD